MRAVVGVVWGVGSVSSRSNKKERNILTNLHVLNKKDTKNDRLIYLIYKKIIER